VRLRSSQSLPEHWSKDYVEHLRTVHLALITVSVGLIILLTSKPYDAASAASELSQVITKIRSWRVDNVVRYERHTLSSGGLISFGTSRQFFSPFVAKVGDSDPIVFELDGPNQFLCSTNEFFREYEQFQPSVYPNTFWGVVNWYDAGWSDGIWVDSITEIATGVSVNESTPPTPVNIIPQTGKSKTRWAQSTHKVKLRLVRESRCDSLFFITGFDGKNSYTFEVTGVNRGYIKEGHPVSAGVKSGLANVYPDLWKASQGRRELDLQTLAADLNAETDRRGETFEAFGLKFADSQMTRWGALVLLAVQLYFVTYLKRLSASLRVDDPGWDVPWIAMDNSLLARSLLFISTVLLPGFASLILFFRTLDDANVSAPSGNVPMAFAALACCLASLFLCRWSWKYRPRLSQSSAKTQLFE
jgi:hypothetical protein